ncbi:MAG TPA: glycosyltransferase family 4 protein [Gemmatimonadaceae bacterium]|nr:glycosyltransferase family 4 protein [Gemmatimonadaceae bacterium]
MKVLFLTHSFPRFLGDAPGSFLLRLAVALRGEDVQVHVVAPAAEGWPTEDEMEGISVERFRYAPRRYEKLAYTGNMAQDVASSWSARLALVGYFGSDFVRAVGARRSFEPDIVHAHWWFPSGVVGRWLSSLADKPLVTTLHGTDVRLAKKISMSRPLLRSVLKHSSRVTTVSSWLVSEVSTLVSVPRPEVAPMPVSTNRFMRAHGMREPARFLFAGRLNRQKGLDQLVRAFAAMTRPAMLDVVGEGARGSELKLLASQLGVSDRIVWHGQLTQDQLLRRYQSATAVVVPSTDEGLGLVAAEALLCETPVVAFRSGGLTDVIQNGTTGVLVTPGDTAELASALDDVLASPEHASNLGRAGRLFALSAFAPESAARRYANIYRQVLADRPT